MEMVTRALTSEEKVTKALELLEEGRTKTEVAEILGYSDVSGLSNLLKRYENNVQVNINLDNNLMDELTSIRQEKSELYTEKVSLEKRLLEMSKANEKLTKENENLTSQLTTTREDLQSKIAAFDELMSSFQEVDALYKTGLKTVAQLRLKRVKAGKQLRFLFLKENVLIIFMIVIALGLAIGVTGPVYEGAGIFWLVAILLGFGSDYAGMIFIYRRVKGFHWAFAACIVLQVGVKLAIPPEYKVFFGEVELGDKMVGLDAIQISKAIITAFSLGVAVFGLGKVKN